MIRLSRALAVVAMLLSPAASLAGSSVRYALVVGNNRADPQVLEIDPLVHAEREAEELASKLVQHANFDPGRIEVVAGRGREEVLAAASRLAAKRRADKAELGDLPTLFAFFFTGHGLSGKLVTRDGSLSGEDLKTIVSSMDTSLTLGFFDACYSGSLALDSLKSKGITVTPGFNPITELPREILDSEGSMWFVSSRENEVSYEDTRLGGLFMHFFTEAFTRAPVDGIGVPLETMWEYARRRTAEVASRNGRVQTPEKIVRSLKARGPLYFSFPRERTTALRFDPDVEGTFLLQYVQADLAEKVVKHPGAPLRVPAFEGEVVLVKMADAAAPSSQRFTLRKGDEVAISKQGTERAASRHAAGFAQSTVRAKGEIPGLAMTRRSTPSDLGVGVGYRYALLPDAALAASQHLVVEARWMRGPMSAAIDLSLGKREQGFETWSYSLWDVGLQASVGYGFDLKYARLDLEARAGPSLAPISYGSGTSRIPVQGWLGGGARLYVPIPSANPWIALHASAAAGMALTEGLAAADTALHASFVPIGEVGVSIPLFVSPVSD